MLTPHLVLKLKNICENKLLSVLQIVLDSMTATYFSFSPWLDVAFLLFLLLRICSFKFWYFILKKMCLFLLNWKSGKEQRETESCLLASGSLPKCPWKSEQRQVNPGTRNSIQVPHVVDSNPNTWARIHCVIGAQKLNYKWGRILIPGAIVWAADITSPAFTPTQHAPVTQFEIENSRIQTPRGGGYAFQNGAIWQLRIEFKNFRCQGLVW